MDELVLENVKIIFRNFAGLSGPYNDRGDRTFSVLIDDVDLADDLKSLGWAVKPLKFDPGEEPAWHLPVKVNLDSNYPPQIIKVSPSTKRKVNLFGNTVETLDILDIEYVDVVLNPYLWTINDKRGVKAYLRSMYVMITESVLDLKWADYGDDDLADIF